jgi:adenylate cyclase
MAIRLQQLRPLLVFGVALIAALLGLGTYGFDLFRRLELDTVDTRFSIRGDQGPPSDIVVVGIDEPTFDRLKLQWPFPRSVHAKVIDALRADGAKAIAYDVQFTEPTSLQGRVKTALPHLEILDARSKQEDEALALAAQRAGGRIVLGTSGAPVFQRSERFLRTAIGAREGNVNLPNDPDRVIRRFPFSVGGLKSFAITTAEVATGRSISKSEFGGGNSAWIDYRGPPGTITTIPFWQVVERKTKAGSFRGKTVVVGATTENLHDDHPTSVGGDRTMSGAEIEANAISTARRDFPLDDSSSVLNVVVILLFAIAVPLAGLRLTARWIFALAGFMAIGYAIVTHLAFGGGRILPFVYPMGALAVSSVGALAIQYATAALEREHVREVFSRFVPEQVVEEALDSSSDDLRLPAVRRQCTVMFADLRGFTSFAEALKPERVVDVLNRYLTEMSGAILDKGGTLVAYMGDGIMAVFGAPLEQADHADRALAAAREMLWRLERFNQWIRGEGLGEGFRMGIGINSGTVMSGNIGSPRRLEYTAIGDTTNAAARLEGMTKGTPYQVFVSDSTRAMLRGDAPDLHYIDAVPVRGKVVKANLWALAEQAASSE